MRSETKHTTAIGIRVISSSMNSCTSMLKSQAVITVIYDRLPIVTHSDFENMTSIRSGDSTVITIYSQVRFQVIQDTCLRSTCRYCIAATHPDHEFRSFLEIR